MIVTAKKIYTINWDGSAEDYIRLGNAVSLEQLHERLDSLDMGDATGAFCEAHDNLWEDSSVFMWKSSICQVDSEWELFEYEGNLDTTTTITEEQLEA